MLKHLCISLPITLLFTVAQAQTSAAVVTKPAAKPAAATSTAVAAAPAAATSTAAPAAPAANPTKFSLSLTAGYTVQAEAQTDATTGVVTRPESLGFEFIPGMSFGDGYNLGGYLLYSNSLTDTAGSTWTDPQISLSRKGWELGKYFKLSPHGALVIPMTDASRDSTDLKYAVAGRLALGLNTKNMGIPDFSATYRVQYWRFFTDFATNAAGTPVTQHRVRNEVILGYKLAEALSAEMFFRYQNNISSENVIRDSFVWSQTIEYSVNDVLSVNVGHSNSGDAFPKAKEYQGNLKFFDSESSEYSIGMGLSI